jgi:AcrR family transcriptional regulator
MTDPPTTPQTPPRRADAERNRQRILNAARDAFADPNADVSMAEIARRARIGSATLYRNFASRRELLEALYVHEIDAVCVAATTVPGDSPGAILTGWLRRFYAYFTSKRVVAAELLEHSSADDPLFGSGYARVLDAGRPLLTAARRSGEVPADLTLEQILDLIASIAKIPGTDSYRKPILEAALGGLTTISKHDTTTT